MSHSSGSVTVTKIDDLPTEVLQRVFHLLNLESKLSAGLTCRHWFDILNPVFAHLTDVVLIFEDEFCNLSSIVRVQETGQPETSISTPKRRKSLVNDGESGSGLLTVNLCACPQHLTDHREWLIIVLLAAGRYVKKLIVEDYLLQKDSFVTGDLLTTIVKLCPKLDAVELHHIEMNRISEKDLSDACRLENLTELFLEQCTWRSWTETMLNRALKSIIIGASRLREIHITACPLLNDRILQLLAKMCLFLWYVDVSGCRNVTAKGLASFFYSIQSRRSDLLYLKIFNTTIDGNELQYMLYSDRIFNTEHSSSTNSNQDESVDRNQWSVCSFLMETGHRACAFQNRYISGKSIIIFI